MALFFGLRANARKAQAAVLVQNLLELISKRTDLGAAPGEMANKLVALVWDRNPQWFGPNRPLPNKFVLAACALSSGAHAMRQVQRPAQQFAMMWGLGEVLKEIDAQLSFNNLQLTELDKHLVEVTTEHMLQTY